MTLIAQIFIVAEYITRRDEKIAQIEKPRSQSRMRMKMKIKLRNELLNYKEERCALRQANARRFETCGYAYR